MCAIYCVGHDRELVLGRRCHLSLGPLLAPEPLRPALRAVAARHAWHAYSPGMLERLTLGIETLAPYWDLPLPRSWPASPAFAALAGTSPAVVEQGTARFDRKAVELVLCALSEWSADAVAEACERERAHLADRKRDFVSEILDHLVEIFTVAEKEKTELALSWDYR